MFLRIHTIILLVLLLIFIDEKISAQDLSIKGRVTDQAGNAVGTAYLTVKNSYFGITDENGEFSFSVPDSLAGQLISVSHIGYITKNVEIPSKEPIQRLQIVLDEDISALRNIFVTAERSVSQSMITIPVSEIRFLPTVSGGIEAVLKTLPGVNSANELSSQYSVRGGSFDENLVYVNDVEIIRPFLIRSGQQEGLPFINPDLVESVSFSSGGFGPEYGDKLSSVLDVRYRDPDSIKASFSPGLLLNSAHAEGVSENGKLKWLAGIRYKSTSMMLKSLDAEGDYNPSFTDFQSVISYYQGSWKASLLSTLAFNRYNFIPQSRTSTFGSESEAYRLFVLFRGNEKDKYATLNGMLTLENDNGKGLNNRLIASHFRTSESETFDIEGLYSLSTLDKNTGSENLTDTLINIGTASWLSHARSYLDAAVTSLQWRGSYIFKRSEIKWGIKLQSQSANDRIKEWLKVDSAGFMIPSGSYGPEVRNLVSARNSLKGTTAEIFAASSNNFRTRIGLLSVSTGIRGSYSDITGEAVASPRVSAKMKFNKGSAFWISGGLYIQPPFYREMRFPDGALNKNVKSQKSVHFVSGYSLYFKAWDRSFRFTAEAYNKSLYDIIPYRIDNVRLIYYGDNEAKGFSRGIDLRVNGEFVEGTESWFSLSVMQSKLEIPDLPGVKFPAPNDQRFKVSIFFQDWLPSDPSWNFHLNLIYSSGLPITSPFNERYDQYHRIPPYRRVDMGITKIVGGSALRSRKSNPFFRELVFGAEIFNLLDIHNTVSYLWIETVNNLSGSKRVFAVPNYLTGRSLNLKLRAEF